MFLGQLREGLLTPVLAAGQGTPGLRAPQSPPSCIDQTDAACTGLQKSRGWAWPPARTITPGPDSKEEICPWPTQGPRAESRRTERRADCHPVCAVSTKHLGQNQRWLHWAELGPQQEKGALCYS